MINPAVKLERDEAVILVPGYGPLAVPGEGTGSEIPGYTYDDRICGVAYCCELNERKTGHH